MSTSITLIPKMEHLKGISRRISFLAGIGILAAFSFAGRAVCAEEKIFAIVTIPPLAEFVRQVSGDQVHVTVMVPPASNPHVYEPTPHQLKMLSKARVYFSVGAGLEFESIWLDKFKDLNPKLEICNSSRGISLLESESGKLHKHVRHLHGHFNPHVWLSPKNAMIMVRNISECLANMDSEHGEIYKKNADLYADTLKRLDNDIRNLLSNEKGKSFLVFHPAWTYFAGEYALKEVAIEHDGKEPSAAELRNLIDFGRRENVKAVFVSPQLSKKSAQAVASEVGAPVVVIDDLNENYVENLKRAASAIQSGTGKDNE